MSTFLHIRPKRVLYTRGLQFKAVFPARIYPINNRFESQRPVVNANGKKETKISRLRHIYDVGCLYYVPICLALDLFTLYVHFIMQLL